MVDGSCAAEGYVSKGTWITVLLTCHHGSWAMVAVPSTASGDGYVCKWHNIVIGEMKLGWGACEQAVPG